MANFFSRLFGKKSDSGMESIMSEVVEGVIKHGNFNLDYTVSSNAEAITINFTGDDGHLLTDKDAMVLDGMQTFLKRFIQNKYPDKNLEVIVDCDGYLEASAQDLRDLADKLKINVLERGQASYVRALPPRDRKTVHRHLALDERVKSQSIGEGFCKKIKISIAGQKRADNRGETRGDNRSENRNDNRDNRGNRPVADETQGA